jgi:tetrahydromethanopterin S-methyltransferase subunit G
MTHSEDVPRFRSAEQNQEFLLFRIDALQKRVEFLEAQSEINLVELYNQNK